MTAAGDDPLARPLALGEWTLRNRFVMTPHLGRLPPARLLRYLTERADHGVAMAVVPAGAPVYGGTVYPPEICDGSEEDGRGDPDGIPYHPDDPRHRTGPQADLRAGLEPLADALHRRGTVAVGQIHHPGAEQTWETFRPVVAPSPVPADGTAAVPHPLTRTEIDDLVRAYLATAESIVAAGMAGVEVHAAHGYLLNRFLSPYYNRRTDGYGGDTRGRTRLLVRILSGIRERIGDRTLLGVRLPVHEEVDGGLTPAEVAEVAATVAPLVSYLSLSLGNYQGLRAGTPATAYTAPWLVGPAPATDGARQVRAAVDRPVLVTGRVTTPATARELVTGGAADLVGLARALVADPRFVARALTGADQQIVRCVGGNECAQYPFSCTVNPHAGREGRLPVTPAAHHRRVVVVGAGPAGVEAAVAARARGHEVAVLEATGEVGGAVAALVGSPLLAGWTPVLERMRRRLRDSGASVLLGTTGDPEQVAALDPDVVVVATGAAPAPVGFRCDAPVLTTADLLAGRRPTAGPVVVVGGSEPHLEPYLAADLLAAEGWPVTLLSQRPDPAPALEPRTRHALLARLYARQVVVTPMCRVQEWDGTVLRTRHTYSGRPGPVPAGAVVVAHGRVPADPAAAELVPGVPGYVVGDAAAPRRLAHAVLEGLRFGRAL